MLKIYLAILLFTAPALAQMSEERLGAVIAMERKFIMDITKIITHLESNEKQTEWESQVIETADGKDIVSQLSRNDFLFSAANKLNVVFIIKSDGYAVSVHGPMGKEISKASAVSAIQEAFSSLSLTNKVYSSRFLKIDR